MINARYYRCFGREVFAARLTPAIRFTPSVAIASRERSVARSREDPDPKAGIIAEIFINFLELRLRLRVQSVQDVRPVDRYHSEMASLLVNHRFVNHWLPLKLQRLDTDTRASGNETIKVI